MKSVSELRGRIVRLRSRSLFSSIEKNIFSKRMPPKMGKRAKRSAYRRVTGQGNHRPRNQRLNGEKLIWYPKNNGFFLPPQLQTRLRSVLYGSTTSGAGSGSYAWGMTMNSLYHPWNTATWSGLTPIGTAFATLAPGGFPQLCNLNQYQSYRVISSVISVNVTPQSVTDSVRLSIVPTNNLGAVLADLQSQRFARNCTFSANRPTPNKDGLINRMKIHNFVGVPLQAIENDLSFNFAGNYNSNPAKLLYWAIGLNTGDNAALSSPLEVAITVTWEVIFFNFCADLISDSLARERQLPSQASVPKDIQPFPLPSSVEEMEMMDDLHISLPPVESKCSTT